MEKINGNIIYNTVYVIPLVFCSSPGQSVSAELTEAHFWKASIFTPVLGSLGAGGKWKKNKNRVDSRTSWARVLLHTDSITCFAWWANYLFNKEKYTFKCLSETQIAEYSSLNWRYHLKRVAEDNAVPCSKSTLLTSGFIFRQSASCMPRNTRQKCCSFMQEQEWLTVNTLELLDLPDWNVLGTHTMEFYL